MEDQEKNGSESAGFVPLAELRPARPAKPEVDPVYAKLSKARGKEYWRSLDELANTEEFQRYLKREFPMQAPRDMTPLSRRDFMRVMGATMALAGVGGCAYQPPEKIVPYVQQPELLVPGKPLYFATAYEHAGYAIGLLGETHMGRPIKLEGNPEHPASLGATHAFAQASLLQLYDPDRAQGVRFLGGPSTWDSFTGDIVARLNTLRAGGAAGIRIVTAPFTSPTLANQMQRFLNQYPGARVCIHDPAGRTGGRAALGNADPVYRFDRAERILSLDSDFLTDEPGSVRYARDFSQRRRVRDGNLEMSRLYVVESTATITGAKADHRLGLKPLLVEAAARAIAAQLGVGGAGEAHPEGVPAEFITAVVQDLREHAGRSIVVPGAQAPPAIHALAHAINTSLGNIGQTVTYSAPVQAQFAGRDTTLSQLTADIAANRVDLLLVIGDANPVYSAPADVDFGGALKTAVELAATNPDGLVAVRLGLFEDETANLCQWFVPQSHYLEGWSDVVAYDGTTTIQQPLITPLYASHTVHELFGVLTGQGDRPSYEIVREYWKTRLIGDFEGSWRKALHSGVVTNVAPPAAAVVASGPIPAATPVTADLEIVFRPDPTIWDGGYANNQWLQELPKPLTQLTWDNAALMSPATMKQLKLKDHDMVEVTYAGRKLELAAYKTPAHPDGAITIHLGYGRTQAGRIAKDAGFNAYKIRTSDAPWGGSGIQVRGTGKTYKLASAQMHFYMEGRGLVKTGTVEELRAHPDEPHFMGHGHHQLESLYDTRWPSDVLGEDEGHGGKGGAIHGEAGKIAGAPNRSRREPEGPIAGHPIPAWGMVIDLNACIRCNACVIACQSENNISTVGKDQVMNNREMHWIRVSTYYTGDEKNPQDPVFQPVACMHCEKAPCEPVCPVEATSHSPEGINEMTYNRCIGTRYCENNCPYKVRRFNYFQYADQKTPTIELMRNPDVTVRSRGVMEKCTYCVQRVNQARIEAEKEERRLVDGDVITACAQVCPTQAIIFGDINDTTSNKGKGSRVRQAKHLPINYGLLTELNTHPRTSYLANLRNPNPALAGSAGETAPEAGH
ncbi:MAG: TAT-variant-translocated molybdopterin oxidoreductase [Actinomycetota bacterium]